MTDKYIKRTQGFTLVELSIVIIIIGFLIAGISAGQSLIHQAALNSTITDYGSYTTAFYSFESRYGYLPGDIPNAQSYWPAASNGNGDGVIDQQLLENVYAWQDLSLAGTISGNYTGAYSSPDYLVPGINLPGSRIASNLGFDFDHATTYGRLGNSMVFGRASGGNNPSLNFSSLTPIDAASLDQKMDDGNPGAGKLFVLKGVEYGYPVVFTDKCVDQMWDAPLGSTVNFLFSDTSVSCRPWFYFDTDIN